VEFKSVLDLSEINHIFELLRSDTFSASCALSYVSNDSSAIAFSKVLNIENSCWAECLELTGILVHNILLELDIRDKTVVGC
jgi:hypothetical protein